MKCFSVMMVITAWVLAPSLVCADEALGRLFYTPEQRARMDVARQHQRSVKIDEEESAPQSDTIRLNGVITRSDGKSILWVNNRVQNGASLGASVGKGGVVRIITPDAKRTVPLKVGQSIDMTSGVVEEVYHHPLPVPVSEKEMPPATTSPGAEKLIALPGRRDDKPAEDLAELSSSR